MDGIVYLIINKINGKKYVGQTTKSLFQRWYDHCYTNKKRKGLLHKAIDKYGKENFEIKELAKTSVPEMLDDLEKFHIVNEKCSVPNGYNLESGGNKFKKLHTLTIDKIKESNTGWNCKQPSAKAITCLELATGIEKSYKHQGFARADGFYTASIQSCLKGLTYSHSGFRFKNVTDSNYPNFKEKRTPKGVLQNLEIKTQDKLKSRAGYKVLFIAEDIKTKEITTMSLNELKLLNFDKANVFRALNKKTPTYKGKIWRRKYIQWENL